MNPNPLYHWGVLLDLLDEMSSVERQVVVQTVRPSRFVPDDLLDRWYDEYDGGRGLRAGGISEDLIAILYEFSYHLDDMIDIVPQDVDDREEYIRNDSVWRAIRELADWTLLRIAAETAPGDEGFSVN